MISNYDTRLITKYRMSFVLSISSCCMWLNIQLLLMLTAFLLMTRQWKNITKIHRFRNLWKLVAPSNVTCVININIHYLRQRGYVIPAFIGARRIFFRVGQIRGLGTKVPHAPAGSRGPIFKNLRKNLGKT